MGKFFKTAKKRIHDLDKPKKRQKTHAGKGALIGGAALGAKEALHIKQVNTPGSKARQKFKEYVKMDSKRKVPIIDRKHAEKINKVGWKIKDVLRVSNKKSVALIGGVGALLGAIVGEAVKKPLEKKASPYQQDKHLENYNRQLRQRPTMSKRDKRLRTAGKFLKTVRDKYITLNTGAKKRGRLSIGHVPAHAQIGQEYDPKAVGAHFSAPIPSFKKKASVKYSPNKKLEDAVTSRIALEGTQDKKTMDNLKYYNKVKNSWMTPDIVIRKAEDHLIQKNKKKHGKFIYDTFGNIPDDKYK